MSLKADPTRTTAQNNLIEKAKAKCEENQAGNHKRAWLESTPPDSYQDPQYRVRLFVLQGSSPKGYVLSTPNWIKAFSCWGDLYRTYSVEHERQKLMRG